MVPDQKLIERSCAGDLRAFEELIGRYEKKVYSICYRFIGNHADASDLAQETFIRIYKSLPRFRGESTFLTWVYHITANICRDFLRKESKVNIISLDESKPDRNLEKVITEQNEPLEIVEGKETEDQIRRIMASLPDEYRLILIMRELQGFSYEEIAKATNCPEGTVKSRINRARQALREILKTKKELLNQDYVK